MSESSDLMASIVAVGSVRLLVIRFLWYVLMAMAKHSKSIVNTKQE